MTKWDMVCEIQEKYFEWNYETQEYQFKEKYSIEQLENDSWHIGGFRYFGFEWNHRPETMMMKTFETPRWKSWEYHKKSDIKKIYDMVLNK